MGTRFLSEMPYAMTEEGLHAYSLLHGENSLSASQLSSNSAPSGQTGYMTVGHSAILDIKGVLMNGVASSWRGEVSYQDIKARIASAVNDNGVNTICLNIDSPGGQVAGCLDLVAYIEKAGKEKPLHAYTSGQMCSAAYWIGSACKTITAIETAELGSIGVLMLHVDVSEAAKKGGYKYTFLSSGKYKVYGNRFEPLKAEAKDYIQGNLDQLEQIFKRSVAKGRGHTLERVGHYADGRVFLAKEAVKLGAADLIVSGMEEALRIIDDYERLSSTVDSTQLCISKSHDIAGSAERIVQGLSPQDAELVTKLINLVGGEVPDQNVRDSAKVSIASDAEAIAWGSSPQEVELITRIIKEMN